MCLEKNAHTRNLDFRTAGFRLLSHIVIAGRGPVKSCLKNETRQDKTGRTTAIDGWSGLKSFVSSLPVNTPRNAFEEQDCHSTVLMDGTSLTLDRLRQSSSCIVIVVYQIIV